MKFIKKLLMEKFTMKKFIIKKITVKRFIIMPLCLFLSLSGCAGMGEQGITHTIEAKDEPLQIGLSFESYVIERWLRDRDVFVSTAKELGAQVNVQSANGDVKEQIEQIEYFINKGMDVIVVVAADREALSEVMKRAKEQGIKTMSYDRVINNANCDMHISFDNIDVGRLMGQSFIKNIPDGGKVFMIGGSKSDNNVALMREGFLSAIKGSGLKVVYENNCEGWLSEYAFTYAKQALVLHPDVKGIMCGNDDLATQVFYALSEKRRAGDVCLAGQDGDLMACQRIVEQTQTMTVFKPVEEQARMAASYAVRLGRGEMIEDIEKTIFDGSYNVPYLELTPIAVTKDNMDEVIIKGGFHSREEVYLNTMTDKE